MLINIFASIVFFALLWGSFELMRRKKWATIIYFIFLPILLIAFWVWLWNDANEAHRITHWAANLIWNIDGTPLETKSTFAWIKLGSVIAGVLWLFVGRYYKIIPTKLFYWGAWIILGANILEASIQDITLAFSSCDPSLSPLLNGIAGLILIATMTLPSKMTVNRSSTKHDFEWDLSWIWILSYTLWNWIFTTNNWSEYSMRHAALLLAPIAACLLFNRRIWVMARAYTLGIYMIASFTIPSPIAYTTVEKWSYLPFSWTVNALSLALAVVAAIEYILMLHKKKA